MCPWIHNAFLDPLFFCVAHDQMSKFNIDSELPNDVMEDAKKRAEQLVLEQEIPEIRVPTKCSNQEFCVLSVLGKNCRQKSDEACVQFLGAFGTIEQAQRFAKDVSEASPQFDLYCASMYKWLPLNTKPEDATNTHWRNEKVDELMKDYMHAKALSKEIFEERKRLCAEQNKKDNEDTKLATVDESTSNDKIQKNEQI